MVTQTESHILQVNRRYVVGASEFWYVGVEPNPFSGVPEHIFLDGGDEGIAKRHIPKEHLRLEGNLVTDILGHYITVYLRLLTENSGYKPKVIEAGNREFQRRLNKLKELEEIAKLGDSVKVPPQ